MPKIISNNNPRALKPPVACGEEESCLKFFDIEIVSALKESKLPIYKVLSPSKNEKYVLKFFPNENHRLNDSYKTESQFINLCHPNVIKFLDAEETLENILTHSITGGAYILMEYAQHGDMFQMIKSRGALTDEKLIRTYFH